MLARTGEAWLVAGVTLLLLLSLEIMLSITYAAKDWIRTSADSPSQDWRTQADAYGGASWVHDYYDEFEESSMTQWASYVYWRREPYQGRYINVDPSGIRRTWAADEDGRALRDRCTIFVFGGSTMWGVGARDDATIASFLAKKLKEKGLEAEVTNFGESGYVSTQEVITLIRELQKGNIPDLAIFYDGVNDVYSAYQQRAAGLPQNEYNRVREFNLTQAKNYRPLRTTFLRRTTDRLATVRFSRSILRRLGAGGRPDAAVTYWGARDNSIDGMEDLLREVQTIYEGNMRIAKALGEAYGFQTLCYWQPTVFHKKHLTPYEETQRKSVEGLQPFCERVYGLVCSKDRTPEQNGLFRDLSGTFSEVLEPVFVDWCHPSEWGNEVIAERIAADTIRLHSTEPMISRHVASPSATFVRRLS